MKLYIIGNGFDIVHGLKTKYFDFKCYLKKYDSSLYSQLNEIYKNEELWSDFEKALASPNLDLLNKLDNFFGKNTLGTIFFYNIKIALEKWIETIDYNSSTRILNVDKANYYFTFNYTYTLENFYNINGFKIKHIHGKVLPYTPYSDLKFGHNNTKNNDVELITCSLKNTKAIIEDNKEYFGTLPTCITEIIVIGVSYNNIDYPYFEVISKKCKNAKWIFYYYTNSDKSNLINNYIKRLKLKKSVYEMIHTSKLPINNN